MDTASARVSNDGNIVPNHFLILGSSSRGRKDICSRMGLRIEKQISPNIDEKALGSRAEGTDEAASTLVLKIATAKAESLLSELEKKQEEVSTNPILLITSDQVVTCDDKVREKPEDETQAREYLESYRQGKPAKCVTGVCVTDVNTKKMFSGVDIAEICFGYFPDSTITGLIDKGEIFTCSGGFVCEDPLLEPYIIKMGSVSSIMGMPDSLTRSLILQAAEVSAGDK